MQSSCRMRAWGRWRMRVRTGLLSNTSAKREDEVFGDPLQLLWKNCVFDLCGVPAFYRKMYRIIVTSTLEERKAWLADVRAVVEEHFGQEA